MRNINKAIAYTLFAMSILIITGCYKVTTLYPETDSLVNNEISFVSDIIPVFNQTCSISGCHSSGGTIPDLTASKAYTALVNGGYINLADPKNSKLYLRLSGKITPAMPLSGPNNPSNINALVLTWITQSAKNN
ncbi:MAG: hypothetical protein Q8N38_07120 [Bacteroidales bacterium]|nr:hypothetical protein [Bacteroidales bacterium]